MRLSFVIKLFFVAFLLSCVAARGAEKPPVEGGELRILHPNGNVAGACPLQYTEVTADIAGFVSRVQVRQTFHNPFDEKIEAVYVFPLPDDAAVNDMVMTVGERRITGQIKSRADAKEVYAAARKAGHVASLLDQERPNIFSQSVTNIEPGARVVIEISYLGPLSYKHGDFEFVFPTVVGPRYMPGKPTGHQGTGWSPDTTRVPDASRISPPVAKPKTRAGHDIRLTVNIDAGSPLTDVTSELHEIRVDRLSPKRARVALANRSEIPNRDFILRYRTGNEDIADAFVVHEDERGRYFTLLVQPPRRVLPAQAVPRELLFVIDRSGSMSGFPIEKAGETMALMIENMNPRDTFNLLSFSNEVEQFFDQASPNTPAARQAALRHLARIIHQ